MNAMLKTAMLAQIILSASALSANDFIITQLDDEKTFSSGRTENVSRVIDTHYNWNKYSTYLGKTDQWIWSSENNQKLYWNDVRGNYQLLVDFNDRVGTEYNVNIDTCTTKAVLAENEVSTFVQAGEFKNAVRLTFSGPCADGGLLEAVFAPGVGLVSYTEQTIAGPTVWEMVSGTVDAVSYPLFTGIEMSAEFPVGRIMSNVQNKISAYITLHNHSNQTETFVFPSSQEFEIDILNAEGEVVNRWSANKRFLMALQEIELPAGSTKRFGGFIELKDFEGQTLDVGSYRVRIELKGSNKPDASVFTSVPFVAESPLYIDQRITLDY